MGNTRRDLSPHLTPLRAGRLYRLISLLGAGPQHRDDVLKKLKIDVRGFYRDLVVLRGLGAGVTVEGTKYQLVGPVDAAMARLPVPDPGLNLRDALVLSRGDTDSHRRFRRRLETLLGAAKPAGRTVGG